jgi:hypothetical protein
MKRLLVIATVVAAAVSLGVLAALVVGPSPARSVPAIELATTTAPPATTAGSARDRAAPGKPGQDDGPATSPPERGGGGATPAPPSPPAPAGDDGGDDDGDDGDDGDDDDGDD